jgi:hypothetical protein
MYTKAVSGLTTGQHEVDDICHADIPPTGPARGTDERRRPPFSGIAPGRPSVISYLAAGKLRINLIFT